MTTPPTTRPNRGVLDSDLFDSPACLGVAVAGGPDGRSVVLVRQGSVGMARVLPGADTLAVAERVAQATNDLRPQATFIDAGHGGAVAERLRGLHHQPLLVRLADRLDELRAAAAAWLADGGQVHLEAHGEVTPLVDVLGDADVTRALSLTFAAPLGPLRRRERENRELDMLRRFDAQERASRRQQRKLGHDPFEMFRSR